MPEINRTAFNTCLCAGVVRVENVPHAEIHIEALMQRVQPEHLAATYGIADWNDADDFLTKLARKSGRLLKV